MDKYSFNANIVEDEGTYIVTFPDVEEAITEGSTLVEAKLNAEDALSVALLGRVLDGEALPIAKYNQGYNIAIEAHAAVKIALNEEFKKLGISKQEFAIKVGKSKTEMQRLLDPYHKSKLDAMSEIFTALHKRIIISVEAA